MKKPKRFIVTFDCFSEDFKAFIIMWSAKRKRLQKGGNTNEHGTY